MFPPSLLGLSCCSDGDSGQTGLGLGCSAAATHHCYPGWCPVSQAPGIFPIFRQAQYVLYFFLSVLPEPRAKFVHSRDSNVLYSSGLCIKHLTVQLCTMCIAVLALYCCTALFCTCPYHRQDSITPVTALNYNCSTVQLFT